MHFKKSYLLCVINRGLACIASPKLQIMQKISKVWMGYSKGSLSNVLVRTSFGKCKIYGVRTDSSDLS